MDWHTVWYTNSCSPCQLYKIWKEHLHFKRSQDDDQNDKRHENMFFLFNHAAPICSTHVKNMDGAMGLKSEANEEVPLTGILSNGQQEAPQLVSKKKSNCMQAHEKLTLQLSAWFITPVNCFLTSSWSHTLVSSLLQHGMMFVLETIVLFRVKTMIKQVFFRLWIPCDWQVATMACPLIHDDCIAKLRDHLTIRQICSTCKTILKC